MAAARSRPRGGQLKDPDEERDLWHQVREAARKGDQMMAKSNELSRKIAELAEQQSLAEERGDIPSSATDKEITDALRQNINLCEKLQSLIGGEDADNQDDLTILNTLGILAALRADDQPKASSSSGKPRDRTHKRKHEHSMSDDRDSAAAESPAGGPSPKVIVSSKADRLNTRTGSSRAGSVPAVREASVKTEEMDESNSLKGAPSTPSSISTERHKLQRGTEVFYRNKMKAIEGEGILCSVTAVIGDGKQRRYEIIDSDPDPPTPPQPYRASVNHLVRIPETNDGLSDLNPRKPVLALYPSTTTFYKAEVVVGEMRNGFVRLKFEGEEEKDREMDVERRYVLPDTGK